MGDLMELDVLNSKGGKVSTVELQDAVFDGTVNDDLIYEAVKMQLACRRRGTSSTKTRSEVAGSGAKPWKQKGTGRARVGTRSNPIWRHGGIAFGPKPRDYSYRMPKKALRGALKAALQYKLNEGRLKVFESIVLSEPKTKLALEIFKDAKLDNALIVTETDDKNLKRATRNLKDFKFICVDGINVYDVLNHGDLAMTKGALEKVKAMLVPSKAG